MKRPGAAFAVAATFSVFGCHAVMGWDETKETRTNDSGADTSGTSGSVGTGGASGGDSGNGGFGGTGGTSGTGGADASIDADVDASVDASMDGSGGSSGISGGGGSAGVGGAAGSAGAGAGGTGGSSGSGGTAGGAGTAGLGGGAGAGGASGSVGQSAILDSNSTQYFAISDGAQTGLDITGDITVECWVMVNQAPPLDGQHSIISKWGYTGSKSYHFTYRNVSGTHRIEFQWNNGSNRSEGYYDITLAPMTWYHVAVAADVSGPSATFYVDGTEYPATMTFTDATSIANGVGDFIVGNLDDYAVSHNNWDGQIDEVRVWSALRAPQDIADSRCNQLTGNEASLAGYWRLDGDAVDSSQNGNDLVPFGGPSFSSDFPGCSGSGGGGGTGGAGGSIGCAGGADSVLAENDGPAADNMNYGTNEDSGQGFHLPIDSTVTAVTIRGCRGQSSSGTQVRVELRENSVDGPVLASTILANSILPPYTTAPGWVDIPLSAPVDVAGGTIPYFVRVYALDGSPNDELRWSRTTTDTYASGTLFNGVTSVPSADHNFRILGCASLPDGGTGGAGGVDASVEAGQDDAGVDGAILDGALGDSGLPPLALDEDFSSGVVDPLLFRVSGSPAPYISNGVLVIPAQSGAAKVESVVFAVPAVVEFRGTLGDSSGSYTSFLTVLCGPDQCGLPVDPPSGTLFNLGFGSGWDATVMKTIASYYASPTSTQYNKAVTTFGEVGYHVFKIVLTPTQQELYVDGALERTLSYSVHDSWHRFGAAGNTFNPGLEIDWIRIYSAQLGSFGEPPWQP